MSAWQSERDRRPDEDRARGSPVKPAYAQKFMQDVTATCREHPAHVFVDAITATYRTWGDQRKSG
jgi:hypothetical protein